MFTNKKPGEVLRELERKGFKKAMLYGGAKMNSSFLKENLIDEFYLYVVPASFGDGITLFEKMNLEARLRLLRLKRFSHGIIGLHYRVVKVANKVKVHD